jgi:hypothetical protein
MTDQNDLVSKLKPVVVNPLMAKIQVPGKIVGLPSGGLMYNNGEIHIRPISAITELKMKNPDMLFSGKAFHEAVTECCPEVTDPDNLFAKDVDSILCHIRMVAYGSDFEIDYVHDCKDSKHHKYNVDLEQLVASSIPLDEKTLKEKYRVPLENGQVVLLEPIRLKHVIESLQVAAITKNDDAANMSHNDIEKTMIAQLLSMINNVDGVTDKKQIEEWIVAAPSKYLNKITDGIDNANNSWGINFEHTIQCKDCGAAVLVDLPINPITFFSE